MLNDIISLAPAAIGIYFFIKIYKRLSSVDFLYHRERPAIIRMEELRKNYDSISDLETVTKIVEDNPDLEIFMYCKYTDFAGGAEKEARFPIKPNSRLIRMLCEEEKKRLRTDMGRTKQIFRLPFHE